MQSGTLFSSNVGTPILSTVSTVGPEENGDDKMGFFFFRFSNEAITTKYRTRARINLYNIFNFFEQRRCTQGGAVYSTAGSVVVG